MSYFTHSLSSPLSNISDHDISGINVFCAHSVKYRRFKGTLDNNEWYILTFLRESERERECVCVRERDIPHCGINSYITSHIKIVERDKIVIPNTQIHDRYTSRLRERERIKFGIKRSRIYVYNSLLLKNILSVCWFISFAFPFGRLLGVR